MIRLGRAVERLSVEQYGAFWSGVYRQRRDDALAEARYCMHEKTREVYIDVAKLDHRNLMRCLREARRDQLARGGV